MKLTQKDFANKSLLISGLVILALFALPVTVLVLQKQQQSSSLAAPSTIISLSPTTSQTSPLIENVNTTFPIDVMINPGSNAISIVTVVLKYDSTKLTIDQTNGFQQNFTAFPTLLAGPVYSDGQVAVELSIGSDPTKAVTQTVKAGTFQFKSIGGTGTTTTSIMFTSQTSALSVGPNDSASENVVASTQPAFISIPGEVVGPTATNTPAGSGTPAPSDSVTPTVDLTPTGVGGPQTTPPVLPTASPSAAPTLIPGPASPRFHGLQTSVSHIISNRIAKCNQTLAKVDTDKRIPDAQKAAIKTEISNQCAKWQTLLTQVNAATNDAQIRQAVSAAINDMLASYTQLAQQIGNLNQGMQFIATKMHGNRGKSVQSLINSMNSQIGNIGFIAGRARGNIIFIQTASSSATISNNLQTIKGHLGQIKHGFLQIKQDMETAENEVEQDQGNGGPSGSPQPTQNTQPSATPTP